MLATLVDTDALWKIVLAAFGGGVGITAIYGFAVMRAEAAAKARHRGAGGTVALNSVLVAVSGAVVIAALVVGFVAMTHKTS
jgi:hypothetical protein